MLKKEDFTYFGKFLKPHGTKGEITLQSESITLGDDCDFVACEIDGILVPFFFESTRPKNGDTIIAKIERMNSAEEVAYLTNRSAYIPKEWTEDNEILSWGYFKEFKAIDETAGELGKVVDIDESTINTLFVIENGNKEILVPVQEEFIVDIDHDNKVITFSLPEGLVTL